MTILLVKIEIIVQIRSGMIDFTFGITLTGFSHSDVTYIDFEVISRRCFPVVSVTLHADNSDNLLPRNRRGRLPALKLSGTLNEAKIGEAVCDAELETEEPRTDVIPKRAAGCLIIE